mmetsp:Transcript_20896/g.32310  ORF Transcript_20896/g.32310 Transcript_20896/m.32310 type:complete len:382 (-) Transcript_20896:349-1494(-)
MYDADGVNVNETEALFDTAVTYEYEVVMRRMINGQSAAIVQAVGNNVEVVKPISDEKYTSLGPYSGNMRVKCTDRYGKVQYSEAFSYKAYQSSVEHRIMKGCDHFVDRVQVRDTYRHVYNENGREFIISFVGYDGDPGQFELEITEDNELFFGMGGQTKEVSTMIEYAHDNIFYEPIPFEMLRTYVSNPQLEVTVDGYPAVCRNVDCDFIYQANAGEMTAFTFDADTNQVVITGTDLPIKLADIQKIDFAKATCIIDERTEALETETPEADDTDTHFMSATSITCTLDKETTGGTFHPIITTAWGDISIADGVAKEQIDSTLSAVAPTKALNLLGGDILTLTGTNLPWETANNEISITFDDADSTVCEVSSTTNTEIVCET